MNVLPELGKGCYIWRPQNIALGDINKIVETMVEAKVGHVCIKITNGWYKYTDIYELCNALRRAGIEVGAWSYIYLKWAASAEADAIHDQVEKIKPAYLLLDIEDASTFWQNAAATTFINRLRAYQPELPMGLNSYWWAQMHPEIPYIIRNKLDFDAPQIYSRGDDPVRKYDLSKVAYAQKSPSLPFALPAGDMYFEHGVKPTPNQIIAFMQHAKEDPEARGVVMWAADQIETTPELWNAFAAFDWQGVEAPPEIPGGDLPPCPTPVPLFIGSVKAYIGLKVRDNPSLSGTHKYSLKYGSRVEIWDIKAGWYAINQDKSEWVYAYWVKKV